MNAAHESLQSVFDGAFLNIGQACKDFTPKLTPREVGTIGRDHHVTMARENDHERIDDVRGLRLRQELPRTPTSRRVGCMHACRGDE